MKKNRLIPILLLKNGWLVQSIGFKEYKNLGNPITAVKRLSEWGSDELIYLDITKDDSYDLKRDDQRYENKNNFLEIIKDVSKATFMPFTIGGKIKKLSDIEDRLKIGADKISINSVIYENVKFIYEASREFGSQCIVASIDVKFIQNQYMCYYQGGNKKSNESLLKIIKKLEDSGVGEILINSIDRDGSKKGYDINLLNLVSSSTSVPVIACGGVGNWDHLHEGLVKTNVDAVAAANIFHFIDQSVYLSKKFLYDKKLNVRKPDLLEIN